MVEDVKPYEFMKLRLLNGGHSCLSYISVLCGYNYVDDAMANPLITGEVLASTPAVHVGWCVSAFFVVELSLKLKVEMKLLVLVFLA